MTEIADLIDEQHWLTFARCAPSAHHDERPAQEPIDLVVIHCVSLPEGQFGTGAPERLFLGELDVAEDPSFADLEGMQVAPHLLIDRAGEVVQFVPFDRRAWHAGVSCWQRRQSCNGFSIGIELEGDVASAYTLAQYQNLHKVLMTLCHNYPAIGVDRIVGHSEIAPGRKTDPGPFFDWQGLLTGLSDDISQATDAD
ncbi:MAG: 1,6-anhydro-N-acetylmuramyl-L-alanine amidase AmpD [Pseudomonadota bacterium]